MDDCLYIDRLLIEASHFDLLERAFFPIVLLNGPVKAKYCTNCVSEVSKETAFLYLYTSSHIKVYPFRKSYVYNLFLSGQINILTGKRALALLEEIIDSSMRFCIDLTRFYFTLFGRVLMIEIERIIHCNRMKYR